MTNGHPVPRYAVDRPALRARVDAGATRPLTLVVAPAGSGKTVLLAQWAATRPPGSVAWIDVEPSDADALLFGSRLLGALAGIDARLSLIEAPTPSPNGGLGEPFIEVLASALAGLGDFVVVFDDVHNIAGSAVVADLNRLVDRLPSNAHFLFASRIDLPLGLSRRRLEHGLVELRQAHLAFTVEVTAQVLEHITESKVDDATVAAVTQHTEGWAAGVQLSALSMRSRARPDQFAEHLIDTDRLIIDYLTEEVYDAQTPERRDALMRLSVLDGICAGLAETVTGVANGEELLRQLECESMFLNADPGRVGWYRFHHLFRDLLRHRLRAMALDLEPEILQTAAAWHFARAETAAGMEYLIRARDWDAVCEIALTRGHDVYERLGTTLVARWLSLVPEEVRWANPRVELLYGILVGISGRGAQAAEITHRLLAADILDVGERQVALAYAAACVYFQPHADHFLDLAQQSLALLVDEPSATPPDLLHLSSRPLLECVSWVAAGRAQLLLGDISSARAGVESALASSGSGYGPYRVQILGTLAVIEAWAGRLQRATELSDAALDLASELSLLSHPAPADAHIARAIVAIQRGEPAAGAYSLHEGNIRAAANQRTQLMWIAYLASALIDPRGAEPIAIEPAGSPPPIVARALSALEWRRARLSGNPREVGRWLETQWSTLAFEHVAALLERGAIADARMHLERACFVPDSAMPAARVENALAWTWVEHAEGRVADSRKRLSEALDLAESEWLAHPLIAAGPTVLALVRALPGRRSAFRQQLTEATATSIDAMSRLPKPLTARELELLAFLPTRLTSPEIAANWYVSVNTIKTHLAHLYRKLEVADRNAAISRAHELGLLPEGNTARTW
jgi:ATP/maltotriose-dependent transcriptional regulator MalT